MLNFVLCDDNENVLNKFSKMLDLIFVNNDLDGKVSFVTSNPKEVLEYAKNNQVDVLILDIDLKSEISGIDIANKIRNINKKVYLIFATAHLEYLMLAYKCKTFDYLPKPISLENLESTVLRLFNDINENQSDKQFIKIHNRNTIIRADSICYIEKDNMKLIFKSKDANYSVYSSFNKIQTELPSSFIRCHKSYIVNINNITSIEDDIIHFDKTNSLTCTIGQVYKKKFLEVMNNEFNSNTN
ncbi:MAG: response regulator transcription factor [Clostridia bacterium]|nr:response regulator transcription factor [Clostridia bacterium]